MFYLIFVNLANYSDLHSSTSPLAFAMTAFLFAVIFFILELLAIRTIGKSESADLLRASERGRRSQKAMSFGVALGVLSLGVGYYLSLSSKSSKGLAVILIVSQLCFFVIAGTEIRFTSAL